MRIVCGFVLSLAAVNQVACGGSQAQRALVAAAAYTAIEVAASALQAAADQANSHDAAKQAASGSSRRTPTGNWRLVRNDTEDECDSPTSEAQQEECEAKGDGDDVSVIETEEAGVSLGKCIVCE